MIWNDKPLWFLVSIIGLTNIFFDSLPVQIITLFLIASYSYQIGVENCKKDWKLGEYKINKNKVEKE